MTAAVVVAATAATSRWNLLWRPIDGLQLAAEKGGARFFAWDAGFWRIDLEPGITIERTDWTLMWLPHWRHFSADAGILKGQQFGLFVPWWLAGTALLLSAKGVGAARVARRRRRGACPRCGYPLATGGSTCPECGPG